MSKKNPKFSIIIPIYNCDKYISRCLNSVLSQEYKELEVILINDGSKDNSPLICDRYSEKDDRVIVVHKENQGVSAARNDGLKISTGQYILFLDSDDYLSEGYFDEIENILNKVESVELINFGFYSDVDDLNGKNISSDKINYKETEYSSHNEIKKEFVSLWDNTMLYNIWNKVYLKKIIEENKISFPDYNWGEDIEFNKRYLNNIKKMYNSEKCFYHYVREREGSVTKKYNSEIFNIRKNEFLEFNKYFESWNILEDDYYEFSCRRYIERVFGCIENIYSSNMNFKRRYKDIKKMINDSTTREALKYVNPRSKKIKIMLIPIKLRLTIITMIMGKTFNVIKSKFPSLFNSLKNRR